MTCKVRELKAELRRQGLIVEEQDLVISQIGNLIAALDLLLFELGSIPANEPLPGQLRDAILGVGTALEVVLSKYMAAQS